MGFKRLWIPLSALVLLVALSYRAVYAADITVDAATPYAAADGRCSLVEAIDNANDDAATHADCPAGAGADTITLTRNIALNGSTVFNLEGDNGLPPITSDITIEGATYTIRRRGTAPDFRIFYVAAGANLTLNQVTIRGGRLTGAFANGGGILSRGDLTLNESVVRDNTLTCSAFGNGGGIYTFDGLLTLNNSQILNNAINCDIFSFGGGIYQVNGTLTLNNTQVLNNSVATTDDPAQSGGGGIRVAGTTTIINSTISNNTAAGTDANGGGILTFGDNDPATAFQIINSTISNNTAPSRGGGMANGDNGEVFGTTFSGNTVTGDPNGIGGAIANQGGTLLITNSVFENNRALNNAVGGAIANLSLGEVTLNGSIVRNNTSETDGGGLWTQLAEFTVNDSLIIGNSANAGGGIFQGASNVDGFFVNRTSIIDNYADFLGGGFGAVGNLARSYFTNSTFSGNTSPLFGGGIGLNQGGQVDLLHVTVVDNTSTQFINSVGGVNAFAGQMNIGSTIIAYNQQVDCSATNQSVSLDFNITTGLDGGIPVDRWCSFIPIQPNDQPETDPLLEGLAYNGNIGPTYLLQAGSPAVDAIPADCPAALQGVDQRGVPREAGSCDVGAIADQTVILPEVYFIEPSSIIDDEGTAAPPHLVELVIDNTNGNLPAPGSLDLSVYLTVKGTAGGTIDYAFGEAVPTIFNFDAVNWPAPGTSTTIQLDFSVIDDLIYEGNETILLDLSLVGPGILGTLTQHTITIIDDDLPPPVPVAEDTVNDEGDEVAVAPALDVFDPAISKLGFLLPGDTGVLGEKLQWRVTVTNPGAVAGTDIVITDTLNPSLRIDGVTTPAGTATVSGQTVTVTIPLLEPGSSVTFIIETTVLDGIFIVSNTACVTASNASGKVCATGLPVSALPQTGETPVWRPVLLLVILAGLAWVGRFARVMKRI